MARPKPSVLTFCSYYAPGFKAGGPVVSIRNLVTQLSSEFQFNIVTRDRDLGDQTAFSAVSPCAWTNVGQARVLYLPPNSRGLKTIATVMRETDHDLVFLNSFFDRHFTLLPLVARRFAGSRSSPIILAPRGELSIGALRIKEFKKRLFLSVTKAAGVYSDVTWHASTEFEAKDIRRELGATAQRIAIAPNLPSLMPSGLPLKREDIGPLRVVFLSRISPKKNLLFALKTLAQVQAPLRFSVYGPKEDLAYWRRCEAAIAALPPHIHVEYRGLIDPDEVIETLSQYDLFFLPTLGENYGHVIAESLQAGTPVLISDQTPWRDLMAKGLGADLPLNGIEHFKRYIETIAALPLDLRMQMRDRVLTNHNTTRDHQRALLATRALFSSALDQTSTNKPKRTH